MKSFPFIRVWEGCDLNIAKAVRQFQDRWSPYSAASRGKRVDRLIKELIDPAVASYATSSPQRYLSYIPGAGGVVPLSEIVRLVGLNSTARLQRQLLRAFVSAQAEKSERDQQFVATLETLLDLIRSCARKPPFKSKIRDTRLESISNRIINERGASARTRWRRRRGRPRRSRCLPRNPLPAACCD